MPAGHRHATDRVDGQAVAECPNGCQGWQLEVGHSVKPLADLIPADLLECTECGAAMTHLMYEEPSEVFD